LTSDFIAQRAKYSGAIVYVIVRIHSDLILIVVGIILTIPIPLLKILGSKLLVRGPGDAGGNVLFAKIAGSKGARQVRFRCP
jgi:hypothetical protein